MADGRVPGQVLQAVGGEDVVDVPHLADDAQLVAVGRDDAGRLLAAVLERVQAEVGEVRRLRVSVDSNDPAHCAGRLAQCAGHQPSHSVDKIAICINSRPSTGIEARAAGFVPRVTSGIIRPTTNPALMIEVKGLTKYYGEHAAIHDLDFAIERGEVIGFLGLNGAGKTTTLKILGCVLLPTAGDVTVDGIDIARDPHEVRRRIGFLPDTPPLYNEMTVGRYLTFAAELRGVPASEADKAVGRGRGEDGHARGARPADLQPVARLPAARRRRPGAGAQAEAADPRRADQRPRPGADRRDARRRSARCAASTPSSSPATSSPRSARPATACWSSSAARSSPRAPSRTWRRSLGGGGTIEVEVVGAVDARDRGRPHRRPASASARVLRESGGVALRVAAGRARPAAQGRARAGPERHRPAAHRPRRGPPRVDLPAS